MMDELVFARETLRRHLQECVDLLGKAATEYDPAEVPADDLVAALAVSVGLDKLARDYVQITAHRVEQRAKP